MRASVNENRQEPRICSETSARFLILKKPLNHVETQLGLRISTLCTRRNRASRLFRNRGMGREGGRWDCQRANRVR